MTKTTYILSITIHLVVAACIAAPAIIGDRATVTDKPAFVDATVGVRDNRPEESTSAATPTERIDYAADRSKGQQRTSPSMSAIQPTVADSITASAESFDGRATANTSPAAQTKAPTSNTDAVTLQSDIQSDHGQQNLGSRITNLSPQTIASLLGKKQAIIGVYFEKTPRYTYDGNETTVWPDDGRPEFAMREYRLDGSDRDSVLRALQLQFHYGAAALAQAEVRLLVRSEIDNLILKRQLSAISAAKVAQVEVLRTVGALAFNDAGAVADFRIQSIELKNRSVIAVH